MKNFDFNKIENFDEHINSSIPNYGELRDMVVSLTHHLVPDAGTVVDIGCSTGGVIERVVDNIPNISGVGVDLATNLFPEESNVNYLNEDLLEFTPKGDVFISMFTLQFLPIEARGDLLKRIKILNPKATLIVTEKVFMESGRNQEMFTFSYYDYKSKSFTGQELLEKQKSIRTIMKPLTVKENLGMFHDSGFKEVTSFWQSFQFYGWVVK